MDGTNFSAFFYDIDSNITTENLSIRNGSGNVIGKNGLVYSTTIRSTRFEHKPWGNYSIISFFGKEFVPINPSDASKLSRLVLDNDDKYTLKTSEKLDLGAGYSLKANQVDVDGKKVWLELDKDGQYVDDAIVSTDTDDKNWTCKLDNILGVSKVPVLKVHVNQVFQGAVDSIAQIEGLWLIDYSNTIRISSDDEFGKLNNVALNGATITINNDDTFTLTRNSDQEIGGGLYFRIADDTNALRFYAFKRFITPGMYEIRGQVATDAATWTAFNFAGFYYDINDNLQTESIEVKSLNGSTIPENNLVYNTTIRNVHYQSDNFIGKYPVLGFFTEEFIPINNNNASKLSRLVLDSKDKYTLKTGEKLDLGAGYSLQANQVDVDGKKVWLELDKDGQYVDDAIVSTENGDGTWTCELDNILGVNRVSVLKVHVNQVFQGAVDSVAQIEGLWLIDYANAFEIQSDDEFGKLNYVQISGPALTITNMYPITLTRGMDIEIGPGMFIKVANSDTLRYYPYVYRFV